MMVKEVMHMLPVIVALIVANIAAGTVNSMAIEKIRFDKVRMAEGIVKGMIAIAAVFALAYAFDVIDLSGLGFTPLTIMSTGIIVYACKLGVNLIKILGLSNYIKIANPLDKKADEKDQE
ncbi:hypothetical protein [Bacteroides acidifaciens]|uniref:hypothetical protein n=1 Tax=Bacteroides acidifaciens TaxID=85831 RepID=UPI00263B800A|nr:hypothetical protein [Bacteroides acidifaciens]